MAPLSVLSDCDLVTRLSDLVKTERHATVDVIEHLVEMERRRLYLRCSASSLHQYCMARLGYDVDAEGHRCAERRFLTLEHRIPFALGGQSTLDNLCLLCRAHDLDSARQVFGESVIEARIQRANGLSVDGARDAASAPLDPPVRLRERAAGPPPSLEAAALAQAGLCQLGFRRSEAAAVVGEVLGREPRLALEQLLRTCLHRLVPAAS